MTWVEGERESFAVGFRSADPEAPTLCAGWSVRHLLAHVVQRDHALLHNVWDQLFTSVPGQERFMGRLVEDAGTSQGYAALVERFAAGPARRSLMGRFDEALNLVEYVVHHEDLRRGTGPVPPRDLPSAELDEIWRRAKQVFKRAYLKAPVGVELVPRGGDVVLVRDGPARVSVAGPPLELVLHAFGRRSAADVQLDGYPEDVASFGRWTSRA